MFFHLIIMSIPLCGSQIMERDKLSVSESAHHPFDGALNQDKRKTNKRKEVLIYIESVWLTRTFLAFGKLQYFYLYILLKSTLPME